MAVQCNEINQVYSELIIAFGNCKRIKNSDLRKLTELAKAIITCSGEGGGGLGQDGLSAYEVAVKNGYTGNEVSWLLSLIGAKGDKGDKGDKGEKGERGPSGSGGTGAGSSNIYSLEEEEIGTWFDKPIFRKCIEIEMSLLESGGYSAGSVSSQLTHNLGIERITNAYIINQSPSMYKNNIIRFEDLDIKPSNMFNPTENSNNLNLDCIIGLTGSYIIVLEYTKIIN